MKLETWLLVEIVLCFSSLGFLPHAIAQQNVQSQIQSLAPTVLRGASKAAQIFRRRTPASNQSAAPLSKPNGSTVLVPPPEPVKAVSPIPYEENKSTVPFDHPIRVNTWVVMLSFKIRSLPEATGSGGASDIEIYDAYIEDVNGAIVERLDISRTRDSFKLTAPSGSFKAELVPDPDSRTGIANVAGANHAYKLVRGRNADTYTLELNRMR